MACGCGGECCGQPKGLGFLWWGGESADDEYGSDLYGDYDYLFDYGGGTDLYGDYDYLFDYGGNYGGYAPGGPSFNVDFGFRPTGQQPSSGSGDSNWQGLLDWWRELTTPRTIPGPEPDTSTLPPFSGYCPPNTYCGNYPVCSECLPLDNSRAAKAAAAAHKAAQAAAQKAAAQKQQAAQPCPPNTGLVKNQAGKCACPPPSVFSKTYGKCVMASRLTAKDKEDAQAPDWLKWAIAAGIVVVGVKVLQGGKGK